MEKIIQLPTQKVRTKSKSCHVPRKNHKMEWHENVEWRWQSSSCFFFLFHLYSLPDCLSCYKWLSVGFLQIETERKRKLFNLLSPFYFSSSFAVVFLMTMMVATQISSYSYIFCLFCGWKFPRGSRKCRGGGGGISNAIPLVEIIITLIMSLEESRNQPRKNRKEKTGNILQNGGLLGFFQCRV